jgi:Uma2 family endonuclease
LSAIKDFFTLRHNLRPHCPFSKQADTNMQTTEKKKWTYADYAALDDGLRYEILNGGLQMSPAPTSDHQDSSRELEFLLWQYVKAKNLGRIFDAPFDVRLDDENVVQPDILFVSQARIGIIEQQGILGSPDMVVEILSPASIKRDRYEKKALYEKFGVKEYWLVDTASKSIEVFSLVSGRYELTSFTAVSGKVESAVIQGFVCDVADVMRFVK